MVNEMIYIDDDAAPAINLHTSYITLHSYLQLVLVSQGVVIAYFPQSRSNTSITPCHSFHQRLLRLSGHSNSFVRVTSPPLLLDH